MAIPVSSNFLAAQAADANLPVSQVELLLGNYASASGYGSTIASNGDDGSGNYPALGAIDGDRTEINVGPASGADNQTGLSSWRSASAPTIMAPATLTITFSSSRTINYIKLYHLSSHGLSSYKLSYWNGSAFILFAQTSDFSPVAGVTQITTTHTLDIIQFTGVATTQVQLNVYGTVVNSDKANVVEIEIYRLLDITSRVKKVAVSRQRDFKLANPMAASVTLDCINTDRFFSFDHVPTASEQALGFVNTELRPNLIIIINLGFQVQGGIQYVPSIYAYVDSINCKPGSRDAQIKGRDGMKGLINFTDSSNLKTNIDIGSAIQYILNRANVSNYEMTIDSTGITIPYFFTDQQVHLTTIQDLAQAAGDATFYYNEYGYATFKFYGVVNQQKEFTSQADWQSGILAGLIDAITVAGELITDLASTLEMILFQHPVIGDFTSTTALNTGGSPGSFYIFPTAGGVGSGYLANTAVIGRWEIGADFTGVTGGSNLFVRHVIMATSSSLANGYVLSLEQSGSGTHTQVALYKEVSGTLTLIGGDYDLGTTGGGTVYVVRYSNGLMNVFKSDNTLLFSTTDTTYTSCSHTGLLTGGDSGWTGLIRVLPYGYSIGEQTGTWTSPAVDCGTSIGAFDALTATSTTSGGTLSLYTASSPDNVTYTSFVAVTPGTGQINSPVARYLKIQAVMDPATSTAQMVIFDITANWTNITGSKKYPAPPSSFTFSYSTNQIDIAQELSDALGGDSAIVNDIAVQAQPLVLTGANTDVIWQGSQGTPPTNISAGNPLSVTNGDILIYPIYVSGGMDISRMSGANPAAAAITFAGGAAGSWVFSYISPTVPVLKITISSSGNITNLQLQGMTFSSASYITVQQQKSLASIAQFGDRQLSITNSWIVNAAIALDIAQMLLGAYEEPFAYIPSIVLRPTWSAEIGDRVTVSNDNLDIDSDFIIIGIQHQFGVQAEKASIDSTMTLLAVPAGD